MPLIDYFAARDDQDALRVMDQPGGPGPSRLDVVSLKGFDPVVVLAQLEAILTGCTYAEASERPGSGRLVSSADHDSAFVVGVSDSLQDALYAATEADLSRAAEPWSQTDELRSYGIDMNAAHEALVLLAGLVARARSADKRVYCWWAL